MSQLPRAAHVRKPTSIQSTVTRSFGRLAWTGLAAFVVFGLVLTVPLNERSSAQGNSGNGETAFAQKADKMLQRVRRAVARDLSMAGPGQLKREASHVEGLARTIGVHRTADGRVTVDVAVKLTAASDAELKAAGFSVGARVGDMATLQVDVERLTELASLSSVDKISAAIYRHPLNDRARQVSGVENISGQRLVAQTGQGVVVAIIDTGIDFRHADFTVPGSGGRQTRVKALLDMTVYGSQVPDPGWNYVLPGQSGTIGHLYTEADINAALQVPKPPQNADSVKQRDKNGHGTHVAGTAAGNGLSSPSVGTYSGMAPEADLIIVKASRQNDASAGFLTSDIINALQFIQQKAGELNKPFVINLSLGGQLGPHDGTTPDERAIDNLVNAGSGRAVSVAAGNEGEASIHARGTVPAGGSLTLDFNVNGEAQAVDLYQGYSDRFRVTVTRPDGVTLGPVSYDPNGFSFPNGQASDQYLHLFNANDNKGDSDPANDQPDIFLAFQPGAPNGMWRIKLEDADANANQGFDAWTEGVGVSFANYVDNLSHLVASPGTARGALTVGAFVTRSATFVFGYPAPFSSPGPTADGRQKPEISAAGYYLYSSRSTDVADPNFGIIGTDGDDPADSTHYTGLAGTSMATPVMTGSAALMMQSDLNWTSGEIKDAIKNTASPGYGSGWDRQFGFGKLNVAAAIQLGRGPTYTISGQTSGIIGGGQILVNLTGSQTASAYTNNGFYEFRNLRAGGNYTVTPTVISSPYQYNFTPPSYTFSNLSSNQVANFTASQVTYTVDGRITDNNGNGVPGVQVYSKFGSQPVSTDTNGYYLFSNLVAGQSYQIRPDPVNYVFQPADGYSITLNRNETLNFTARQLFKISGRVRDQNGVGVQGVSLSLTGPPFTSVSSNSNGDYEVGRLVAGGNYALTIWASNRVSTPNGVVFINLNANQQVDFVARLVSPRYRISGRIVDVSGTALVGVRVDLSDSNTGVIGATLTGANGLYGFENNEPGRNYTVTPTAPNYSFSPLSRSFTNLSADQTADFAGLPLFQEQQIRLALANFDVAEGNPVTAVTILRSGNTSGTATVNYATSSSAGLNNCNVFNGIASPRCDYVSLVGVIRFDPNETYKYLSIPIVDDSYFEGTELFTIMLNSPTGTGATLGAQSSSNVTIHDNESSSGSNPISQTAFFVRQHYIDFLGREPDPPGFAAWQATINNCAAGDTNCDRIHVSSAFFRSPEFQERGYFVYRFYSVSFGRKPDYAEFTPDIARVSGFLSDAELEAAKVAFIAEFMGRPAFVTKFNALSNANYVDTLLSAAGITNVARDFWVAALGNGTRTRAQVLREIAESTEVYNKYYNEAFVVMQYFGYLRRDPDAFYLDWIAVLNGSGDFRGMVNGFMNSLEYRARFGP